MDDDEILICRHCSKPVESGQAWHTLAEMHYDCYEQKFGVYRPPAPMPVGKSITPKFDGQKIARANSGHLLHVVDGATGRALCGHSPQNNSHRMRNRGFWHFMSDDYLPRSNIRWCATCDSRRKTPAAECTLDAVLERCVDGDGSVPKPPGNRPSP
jgi:hypothetical protein